ncbi:metallophosphoesterase [Tundrisphaera sp. TA3]|uniref:metallophosphoesterase n=1 Tax=Tundrisphaera sp. TA3 TaxID=3435775 RepID=UPI003EB7B920
MGVFEDIPFGAVIAGSTAIDAAVAGLALFGGRGRPAIGAARVGLAFAATSAAFLLKLIVLGRLGVHLFGMMHLVYVDLVVLVPAIGAALLLASWPVRGEPWRRVSGPVRAAAAASLGLAFVGVFASWIEPYRLQLETARLAIPGRDGSEAVRVGVLTDLQTDRVGEHERRAVDLLMAQKPDVILIPGDVFQGSHQEFEANREALAALLARLSAPGGVYLVLGDVDGPGDRILSILDATSIRLLVDEVARTTVNGRRLAIGGVELDYAGPAAQRLVERLEEGGDDGETRILLAHRPDVALGLRPNSRVDLVVAGHTHGGQVVVPGYGPPVVLSGVPREVAAGGLHRIAGVPIYVSRGVGHERGQAPRIRFLCPPEVSVIELGGGPPAEVRNSGSGGG